MTPLSKGVMKAEHSLLLCGNGATTASAYTPRSLPEHDTAAQDMNSNQRNLPPKGPGDH